MPWSTAVPPVIVSSNTRHPNALVMVTFPAPAVFAAMKHSDEDPVSTANDLVPSARPVAVQLEFSVSTTSFAVTHTPVLYADEATATVLSGVVVLLNRAAFTPASATSPAYVVGKPVVAATPRAIGFSMACWKMALLDHANFSSPRRREVVARRRLPWRAAPEP